MTGVQTCALPICLSVGRLSYSYGNDASTDSDYSSLAVSLGANGTYDQLILMLKSSENAARFLNISSFRYSEGGDSESADLLGASFNIDSPYMYVESTAVTDDAITLDITSDEFLNFMSIIKNLDFYEFSDTVPQIVEEATEVEDTENIEEPAEELPVEDVPAEVF